MKITMSNQLYLVISLFLTFSCGQKEKIITVEKKIPVETIKTVEVTKEIPVETIKKIEVVKEVPVEVINNKDGEISQEDLNKIDQERLTLIEKLSALEMAHEKSESISVNLS